MDKTKKDPPPKYTESVVVTDIEQEFQAQVTDNGRIAIDLDRLTSIFSPSLRQEIHKQINHVAEERPKPALPPYRGQLKEGFVHTSHNQPTALNIVVHVVGSRGDIQPFIALGRVLKFTYKHRVRVATHSIFKPLVEENGLEFFSIGGDPKELMAFMVRSPGLLPGLDALRGGDVAKHRKMVAKMMEGCWRACIEEGDGMAEVETGKGKNRMGNEMPFVADMIVANPPSFAHIHCGQKLGVPVHLMFTMPWSATQAFPHPLANIKHSNSNLGLVNYISYGLVETLLWQGIGPVQNKFREKILGLEPIRLAFGPRMLSSMKIPHTYCWSPSLIPAPQDWGIHISVAGFYFLNQRTDYAPNSALAAFLEAGSAPVYIGFGSIIVDNPAVVTRTVFEAVEIAGVRAVVSKGWGALDSEQPPDNVFLIGDIPHDWLFNRVSAVIHHGGAGTTAAAMAAGKPSVIVPFFGDQFFWGDMVQKAGAGAKPIPGKDLTASLLAASIIEVLQPAMLNRAEILGEIIIEEKGEDVGCARLHQQAEEQLFKCSLTPNRVAVWRVKKRGIYLSTFAATILLNARVLHLQDLKLLRHVEYNLETGPWDPTTGVVSACLSMVGNMAKSLGDVPAAVNRVNKARPVNGSVTRGTINAAEGAILGLSKGIGRILLAGFRSPFEVMLLAARGFHNVPVLYGDESVRTPRRITGIVSGFGAMGQEIGYSLYDGISGLFLHPINGARRDGFAGFSKGIGMGFGGFILKPIAATWGIGGYTYEGINKELEKLFGSSMKGHIALARLAQGSQELNDACDKEIAYVLRTWEASVHPQ